MSREPPGSPYPRLRGLRRVVAIRGLLIGVGFLFLAVAILATVGLHDQKPRLPVQFDPADGLVVVGPHPQLPSAEHGLLAGDRLLEIDGHGQLTPFFVDFYLDGLRAGAGVSLVVERAGRPVRVRATLVPSLDTGLLVINFFVSFLVWGLAMLVVFKSHPVRDAQVFFWMTLSLAIVMWVYWPENDLAIEGGHWISLVLNNGLYPMTVAFLLHFALLYPDGWWRPWIRWLTPLIYLPAVALSVLLMVVLPLARHSMDPADVAIYELIFARALPFELASMLLLGLAALAYSYVRARKRSSRQRLKWLFWGFAIGIAPHVLCNELPRGFGLAPLLPEHVTYLFVIFAPTAFFVSVVRYRMLDIDVVIRRSLVYSLLTLFVVGVYLMLVGVGDLLAKAWWGQTAAWIRVFALLIMAAVFEPARRLLQGLIDRIFYRSEYDQRIALMEYSREMAHTLNIFDLAGSLHGLIDRTLPVEWAMVFTVEEDHILQVPHGVSAGDGPGPIRLRLDQVPGLDGASDSGAFAPAGLPHELGDSSLLVPLRIDERLTGLIALGAKRSGDEFQPEDHRFLKALAAQTALAFDRARAFKVIQDLNVSLEHKVFLRTQQLASANDRLAEQYEQLNKLNQMKEALTRMVVHDLKNPVSTILLGLEFLDRSEVGELPEAVNNTLNIISSTAQEIQDLIANLLDVYRMEAGELHLSRSALPVPELFAEATRRTRVLAKYRRVRVACVCPPDLVLNADIDLMVRVLINLVTNAVKHSRRDEAIELGAQRLQGDNGDGRVELRVRNSGPVIPAEFHQKVFEKFFQVEGKKSGVIAGTGLGLAFCKLVVEAHQGRIWVESPVADWPDGACFVVSIPEQSPTKGKPAAGAQPAGDPAGRDGPQAAG